MKEEAILLSQERTLYDTALSAFSRIAAMSSATSMDDEALLYTGPVAGLLRPFCLERVGKVFSRAATEPMDNGLLDNTLTTGGPYSWRHTLVPIRDGDPLTELADTGQYSEGIYAGEGKQAKVARERLKAEELQNQRTPPK